MNEKIAIVVDSGSDVSPVLSKGYPIFSLPLRVIIDGQEFIDGKTITSEEIYEKIDDHKVTTSLPSGQDIENLLDNLVVEEYTHVIMISISSGLSGTYNILKNFAEDNSKLVIEVIDTKSISLGSGFLALEAGRLVKEGKKFDEIIEDLKEIPSKINIFFTVGTLSYLKKGGRIGKVEGTMADILSIKPVISCNSDGVYYTVAKTRGYRKAILKMFEKVQEFVGEHKSYQVVVLDANSEIDIEDWILRIKELLPLAGNIKHIKITPALGIHTGPEALGVAVLINS